MEGGFPRQLARTLHIINRELAGDRFGVGVGIDESVWVDLEGSPEELLMERKGDGYEYGQVSARRKGLRNTHNM